MAGGTMITADNSVKVMLTCQSCNRCAQQWPLAGDPTLWATPATPQAHDAQPWTTTQAQWYVQEVMYLCGKMAYELSMLSQCKPQGLGRKPGWQHACPRSECNSSAFTLAASGAEITDEAGKSAAEVRDSTSPATATTAPLVPLPEPQPWTRVGSAEQEKALAHAVLANATAQAAQPPPCEQPKKGGEEAGRHHGEQGLASGSQTQRRQKGGSFKGLRQSNSERSRRKEQKGEEEG